MEKKLDTQTDLQWIGQRLRELRLSQGLTLQALADRLGTAHSRISDAENSRFDTKITSLLSHLRALGVTPHQFFAGMPIHAEVGGTREVQRQRDRATIEKLKAEARARNSQKKDSK